MPTPSMWRERLKQAIRVYESRLTPVYRRLRIDRHTLKVVRSLWWDDTSARLFDQEIGPYWKILSRRSFSTVVDAGGSSGLFTLSICIRMPEARIITFEPSRRQRVLLHRNLRMNHLDSRVTIIPSGLWNKEAEMAFRTNGAISALQETGGHLRHMPFGETAHVTTLDNWRHGTDCTRVELIKMDIEGAEIEALEGSREVLEHDRPELLVQAYHLRGNCRTLETCRAFLEKHRYVCSEASPAGSGLLHATPAEKPFITE